MRLEDLGWNDQMAGGLAAYEADGCVPGRISLEHKDLYTVLTEAGELPARLIGKMYYDAVGRADLPVVGDWVAVRILDEDPPKALIHGILPRKSIFSRKEPGARTGEQPVASNIDTVFIVVGLDGNYKARRIERYLTLAWESGAEPVVILSKADLCDDLEERVRDAESVAFGVPVHAVSVISEEGLDALLDYMKPGRTMALLGSSGVGKSTIVNYLLGKDVQRIQEVRDADSRGRHTTTHRQMFVLPSGALVIDTPGMRELQLWNADEGLEEAFRDIEDLAQACRFGDCSHSDEPGCAVREALESGTLDAGRFENYLKMRKELSFLARKQDVGLQQVEKAKWKKIHKMVKDMYKHR